MESHSEANVANDNDRLPRKPRLAHRLCVWAGFTIGLASVAFSVLALVMGVLNGALIPNEAAFWAAVAALAFGLTAIATR
jgi:hypothetical protein